MFCGLTCDYYNFILISSNTTSISISLLFIQAFLILGCSFFTVRVIEMLYY